MAAPSLAGWTVGVTADRRAREQIELLERRGARVVHGPTIETIALHENRALRAATHEVVTSPPDVVVLTTGVGARAWFDAADALGVGDALLDTLRGASVVARGPKAAGAALTAGVPIAWQAPDARTNTVVEHLHDLGVGGTRIAVQLDGRAEPVLATELRRLGADVVAVPVYRWTLPSPDDAARRLVDAARGGLLDALTFTSAPAFVNLLAIADGASCREALVAALGRNVDVVSVGSVCSEAARSFGIEPAVEPERQRLGAMVMALGRHASAADDARARRIGTHRVVLRAAALVVDETVTDLAPREQSVL